MADANRKPRRKSASTPPERPPIEIQVVFDVPADDSKPVQGATPADAAAKTKPPTKKERLTFRW